MILDAQYYNIKAKDALKHLDKCRYYGFSNSEGTGCEEDGPKTDFGMQEIWNWKAYIHVGSIAILFIFCIEVTLRIVAMGKYYFHKSQWPQWLDFVVIWTSFLLDVFVPYPGISLVVIIRLWRIVRVSSPSGPMGNIILKPSSSYPLKTAPSNMQTL